ncbi:MAG: uncharacterized protein K0S14_1422 [Thermomicrobiales bacterium]|jgi:hypothetical protein|nr:uncharacterized protein [Thermomicrobiales bacterium]
MAMLTYTDRVVLPTVAAPSLIDIAVSLSRMPRFGGHTRRWWSVLDHTLFCDELVRAKTGTRMERIALLLHDAHEAITGDVPTDAKGAGLKLLQGDLDVAIMDAFFPGGFARYTAYLNVVKHWDRVALVAEAHIIGPPVSERRLVDVEPRFSRGFTGAEEAFTLLEGLLRRRTSNLRGQLVQELYGRPPFETGQERHPAVREYLNRMNILL